MERLLALEKEIQTLLGQVNDTSIKVEVSLADYNRLANRSKILKILEDTGVSDWEGFQEVLKYKEQVLEELKSI